MIGYKIIGYKIIKLVYLRDKIRHGKKENSSTGSGGKHGELSSDTDTYTGVGTRRWCSSCLMFQSGFNSPFLLGP